MNNARKIKTFGTIVVILLLFAKDLLARDSPFTQKSSGPMYWIAYEYCWQHDTAISEARWKANIDWINEHYKSYGYDMICNDGWIEAAQTVNEDGYITKYNNKWEHGFDYWANYLFERDMKLGIYYNPLWMTKKAYDQNIRIKGVDYRTRDIELNKLGLACKPISNDLKDIDNSSRWIGQLPNGDWIVGLFNREDTIQIRKIDFEKELGIKAGKVENIRDLWSHINLGSLLGEYAVELKPHTCKIIRVMTK